MECVWCDMCCVCAFVDLCGRMCVHVCVICVHVVYVL